MSSLGGLLLLLALIVIVIGSRPERRPEAGARGLDAWRLKSGGWRASGGRRSE